MNIQRITIKYCMSINKILYEPENSACKIFFVCMYFFVPVRGPPPDIQRSGEAAVYGAPPPPHVPPAPLRRPRRQQSLLSLPPLPDLSLRLLPPPTRAPSPLAPPAPHQRTGLSLTGRHTWRATSPRKASIQLTRKGVF